MTTTDRRPAIVLVEDNPDDEALTLRAFRKSNIGNEVVVARDGAEALELLLGPRREEIVPQLVLLDLNLPKVDGHEVLRRLREDDRTRLLPVVVLTSSKHDEDMLRSYAEGANAFVRKPVDFGKFADAVKALGLFWLVVNEAPRVR